MEHYSLWNTIYEHFDPVAFDIMGLRIHWYGIAYVCALIFALFVAHFFIRTNPARFPIDKALLDNSYFLWAEFGVIIGARLGYVLIYDPDRFYYLAHPIDIFNPFHNGEFIGIRGMSFHGGAIGFLLASYLFAKCKKIQLLPLLDLAAISVPLAYIFGRVGNFLNQELFGRVVAEGDTFGNIVGILVNGTLRYPSQLLEAFLEGGVVFIIIMICARYKILTNALIGVYGVSYGVMRFIAEYWREPDEQLGLFWTLSMGQILCMIMIILGIGLMCYIVHQNAKNFANEATKPPSSRHHT